VKAAIHSIAVPVPPDAPTDLRFILSSDPQAARIVGREFPITKGIAGWVYKNQQPYFQNEAEADPRHFKMIDQAAGTHTGEGAILTIPLATSGRCYGIIQFMKSKGERFGEDDVAIASRWAPSLTRLLIELRESPKEDIPSIARGNVITASILFSDIRAFSAIASKIRLEATVALLNEYYSRTLPFAIERGGQLREYVGDGLFICFSLDSPTASARAAVISALEMQEEYEKTLYSWRQYNHPVSSINTHSIGIATGPVYSGLVGHVKERREKLVGSALNLAAHLCEAGNDIGGGILICQETAELLDNDLIVMKPMSLSVGKHFQVVANAAKQMGFS
jgi:class 3 adenylate cyclase